MPARSAGKIVFASNRIDFGRVSDAKTLTGSFEFTNTGDGVLQIRDVAPSCGCTAVKPSKQQYEPGEVGTIDVEWELEGFGTQTKKIMVVTNDRAGPMTLTVSAHIDPLLRAMPPQVRFELARLGETTSRIVHLSSDDPNASIQQVQTGHQALGVRVLDEPPAGWERVGPVPAFEKWLRVSVTERAVWGQLLGGVVVRALGTGYDDPEPRIHQLAVSVYASVFGELMADDDMFRIGVVKPGGSFVKEIFLNARSTEPFDILDLRVVEDPRAGGAVSTAGGQSLSMDVSFEQMIVPFQFGYKLTLRGRTGDYLGRMAGFVLIETDVLGEEELRIPFGGMVRDP